MRINVPVLTDREEAVMTACTNQATEGAYPSYLAVQKSAGFYKCEYEVTCASLVEKNLCILEDYGDKGISSEVLFMLTDKGRAVSEELRRRKRVAEKEASRKTRMQPEEGKFQQTVKETFIMCMIGIGGAFVILALFALIIDLSVNNFLPAWLGVVLALLLASVVTSVFVALLTAPEPKPPTKD